MGLADAGVIFVCWGLGPILSGRLAEHYSKQLFFEMDKKTKVLRIIARLNIGGPAIHCILLTEGLNKDKFTSILVSGVVDIPEGDMAYLAQEKNVCLVFIPELGRPLGIKKDIVAFWKLFQLITRERPDIIHTHTAKAGTLGRLAGLLYNLMQYVKGSRQYVKLIHTFHGHVLVGYFGRLKTLAFIWIERILAKFTNRIIVVSNVIKKELLALNVGTAKNVIVIPLGLELDRLLAIPASNSFQLTVGIIGRLTPIKNHYLFLDAARNLLDLNSVANVKFLIVGDGELRAHLQDYSKQLGLEDHVVFTGWKRNLSELYSQIDIVALTSLNEGTPVSLIEAMAAGRAVVATNVGGVKDLVNEERGFLVESGDIDGFVSALRSLLENERLRKRLGQVGREFVRNNFTKERLVRDMSLLYENIL